MSPKFCNILVVHASLQHAYHVNEAVQAVVVGALTCCAFLHSLWDLKTAKMKVQRSLIREFTLHEFGP